MNCQQSLLDKIVRLELEKLNISKKYSGFKYLVDFITFSINDRLSCDYATILNHVAVLNKLSSDAVNHSIKHMMFSSLQNNPSLHLVLDSHLKSKVDIKSILLGLAAHIYSII